MADRKAFGSEVPSRVERRAMGKELRKKAPRSSHGEWEPAPDRHDPLGLLKVQDEGRLQQLLPIKYGRMIASSFAFLRGSAAVMAADLAHTPVTGIDVVLCGDAHLSNFGIFATPERNLVFDLNDFDEAYNGPWEWDVKRLAASVAVAGRQNGFNDEVNHNMARTVARVYRESMGWLSELPFLEIWYHQIKAEEALELLESYFQRESAYGRHMLKKARGKTQEATLARLTEVVNGKRQFINDPPLLVRLSDLLTEEQKAHAHISHEQIHQWTHDYINSLPEERQVLLRHYHITDAALRVVGVGSVGTRCGILLLEGGAEGDAIILQIKQAVPSVLEAYLPRQRYSSPSHRVVVSQHLLQAASDIFLGWNEGLLSPETHYYWRQLKDMKGSVKVETMDETRLEAYVSICSSCLARAHARTGDPAAIAGYLGNSESFDVALGDFAIAYADQSELDHQALLGAVESGKIAALTGI